LEELKLLNRCKVTDAGIKMVMLHCKELRKLDLVFLQHITGVCALCEDPEPTLVL
jgi:hypothetical protein